jgi:peptidoglycan/xylan/chitin deacetylase (PgdA/CDA1 family)
MIKYYKKTPFYLRWIYPEAIWQKEVESKVLYLTFDDGPSKEVTSFVLHELKKFNAKATFFCLGMNALNLPSQIENIVADGHKIGNHSFSHPNGFNTEVDDYVDNVRTANDVLSSNLFRPPYGKMKIRQYNVLKKDFLIVMWDVMPGDFDDSINGDLCFGNVIENAKSGSIIVFHDTAQAFERLKVALPKTLKYYSDLGYKFESII